MSLSFTCSNCSRQYQLDESLAGKRARCKECGTVFRVPSPSKSSRARAVSTTHEDEFDERGHRIWKPPVFEVDGPSVREARSAEVNSSRPARARRAEVDDPLPTKVRHELFEEALPPRTRGYEVEDEDEPVAPMRAPATYQSKRRGIRNPSGEPLDFCPRACGGGIFSIVIGTIMYAMPFFGWVMVTNGVANDPIRQQNGGLFLICLGLLGIFVGLALVATKALQYREVPQLGFGGGMAYGLAVICLLSVLVGMASTHGRGSFGKPAPRQNRLTIPRTPIRNVRPPHGFIPIL
jgi:DNA-directed RNA polymerase subunit RPC12/RpoP